MPTPTVTASQAAVNAETGATALTAFARRTEQAEPYRLPRRISDWWAGRRDRPRRPTTGSTPATPADARPAIAQTPWLTRLSRECGNRLDAERRSTQALLAVLDRSLAQQTSHRTHLADQLADAITRRSQLDDHTPQPQPRTAAEHLSTPAELQARRDAEHLIRTSAARQTVDDLQTALGNTDNVIAVIHAARHHHWAVLQIRASYLLAHYDRRGATYTRALERRRHHQYYQPPTTSTPDWLTGTVPAAPQPTHTDQPNTTGQSA